MRSLVHKLYEIRKQKNVPIWGGDALLVTNMAFYDEPNRWIQATETERNQSCRICIPIPKVTIDYPTAVMLRRTMVATYIPFILETRWNPVNVVNLINSHTLIGIV